MLIAVLDAAPPILKSGFSDRDASRSMASGSNAGEWFQFWSVYSFNHDACCAVPGSLLCTDLQLLLGEEF